MIMAARWLMPTIGLALIICVLLHAIWLALPWIIGRMMAMTLPDHNCAIICASQTLALGLPLIVVCFPQHPQLGLVALPLLIYHPLQLIVAGLLVPRLARRIDGS